MKNQNRFQIKNFWIIVDEYDKSFIKRYNIVHAGLILITLQKKTQKNKLRCMKV